MIGMSLIRSVTRHGAVGALVLGAIVLASIYWLGRGDAVQAPPERAESGNTPHVPMPSVAAESVPADGSSHAEGERAAIGLRTMSQTFQHSTLLVAIRGAGFYCDDVVSARESVDGVWLASCADRSGYVVNVVGAGLFDVSPVLHYYDGTGPAFPVDGESPSERLELFRQ